MKRLILIALMLFPLSCSDGLDNMLDALSLSVPICVTLNGSDLNDGRGWKNAKATIQAAIDAASDSDEIWVAAGNYVLPDNVTVNRSVKIHGGFGGNEIRIRERNPDANVCSFSSPLYCFLIETSVNVIFDGLTFTGFGGNAMLIKGGADVTTKNCRFISNIGEGAVISSEYSKYRAENCEYSDNKNTLDTIGVGGAIFLYNSNTEIVNSLFDGNSAAKGGAIYIATNSVAAISDNTRFYRNKSTGTGSGYGGGAIFVYYATLNMRGCHIGGEDSGSGNSGTSGGGLYILGIAEISDSFIRNNSSVASGGGIYTLNSALSLSHTELSSNFTGSNGAGGGISFGSSVAGKSLDITDCVFNDNYAGNYAQGGGAICFEATSSNLTLLGTVFDHNYSGSGTSAAIRYSSSGGRIVMDNCIICNTPTDTAPAVSVLNSTGSRFSNSLFYSNKPAVSSTVFGGALWLNASSHLVNLTFYDNSAGNGGAVFLYGGATGYTCNMYNTVFYKNTANTEPVTDNLSTSENVVLNRYNCFYENGVSVLTGDEVGCITGNSSDPFLNSSDPGNANFMRPNNLLVNMGYTGAISGYTPPATDLAGKTRVIGLAIDIGAYEGQ